MGYFLPVLHLQGFERGRIQTGLYGVQPQKMAKRLDISDLGSKGIVLCREKESMDQLAHGLPHS